jgi:hypothetical protein
MLVKRSKRSPRRTESRDRVRWLSLAIDRLN